MNVPGLTPAQLDRLGDRYTALVWEQIDKVTAETVARAHGHLDLQSLAVIPTLWTEAVHDGGLLAALGDGYRAGADAVHGQASALTAAAPAQQPLPEPDATPPVGIAKVSNVAAEQYLAGAANYLVGLGDTIWQRARDQLLAGMQAGEGVDMLADRIASTVPEITRPRAEVVARTEINGAANRGSIDQVRAVAAAGTKTWVSAEDDRVRPEHALADGQTVKLADPFMVGGEAMDHPHDHNGSAWNVVNCRCTLAYEIGDFKDTALTAGGHMTADHDHAEVCGCELTGGGGEHFGTSKTVSDAPWDGAASRFTDAQYQNAAAGCDPASAGTVKERCFLPHHEPGGALNRAAVGQAAARVGSLKGHSPQAVATAKAHLRGHYSQLGMPVPDSLKAEADEVTTTYSDDTEDLAGRMMPMPKSGGCPPGMKDDGKGNCVGMSAEEVAALGGKPNPGTKKDKRLKANQQAARLTEALADAATADTEPDWRGPLLVEGRPTGDRREFSKGSVTWPDPAEVPMILQWQKETGHGSDHDVTVAVGRIDRVWRDGDMIMGEGRYDTHADAVEYARRVENGMAGGISVNADDIADADVETVYDEADGEDEGDLFSMLFARPTKVIYHAGRLRGATGCDIPAFVEARIAAVDKTDASVSFSFAPRRPVAVHETDTSPDVWDADAELAGLRMVNPRPIAEGAFAWVGSGDDQVALFECWGLHHEITAAGEPGPANLTACLHTIMQLQDSPVPEEDRAAVHRHLASHLFDAGIRAPLYEPEQALLAHAWQDELWHPRRAWFNDPKLTVPTPIMVTDAGQVFGLAAEWNTCHIGYGGKCVPPPRETYHDRFMTGTVTCDDGSEVPVGQITAGIGHASTAYNVTAVQAAEHYDNTSAVVADVAVGNCKLGIWVAGAIRPWAEAARVQALKASGQVSPDWRRIGGQMRLVGLLTVNVSGYQTSGAVLLKPRLRTAYREGKLQAMIASGFSSVHMGLAAQAAEQERAELERVRRQLVAEMNGDA